MRNNLYIPKEKLADFCKQYYIRRLSLFGSVLSSDFGPNSDIDVLVEFEPEHIPGLIALAKIEQELSSLLGGRKVDIRTPHDLSHYFREEVISSAELQYALCEAPSSVAKMQ
jgi:predicted nucleotidyltransferase